MSVHRLHDMPKGDALGPLLVSEQVLAPTRAALLASSGDGQAHEGLVLWLGHADEESTTVLTCTPPILTSGPQRVHIHQTAVARVARAARRHGLGVVAQVHSHPGRDTRHSDGDDQMILMPFEGMFSVVVADYGRGSIRPDEGSGIHQYQTGRWLQVPDSTFIAIPPVIAPDALTRTRSEQLG